MRAILLFILVWFASVSASAGSLSVAMADGKGEPVAHAVVALEPLFEGQNDQTMTPAPVMQQKGTLFSPFVLPVTSGTQVSFPNMDEFRHQVYSFSRPKPFELRLYGQDESKTVLFDKSGVVALGCNIHDNMLAYVYISDHKILATTQQDGNVIFDGLEPGQYKVHFWHPDIVGGKTIAGDPVVITAGEQTDVAGKLELRRVRREQQPPEEDDYN